MALFTSWDQEIDYEETLKTLDELASVIAPPEFRRDNPGFPWGDPVRMLDYNFAYEELDCARAAKLRQVTALYSKLDTFEFFRGNAHGIDGGRVSAEIREYSAYNKFVESEIACRNTNEIFRARSRGELCFPPWFEEVLLLTQMKIADILGPVPQLSQLKLRLGSGGTTTTIKKNASVTQKMGSAPACSEPLVPYLSEVLHELPAFCNFEGEQGQVAVEVHYGKLAFVSKNAKTYRSVVSEPVLNGLCQAGVGDFMKHRLLRAGIDLRDQSRNQELARMGSLTGEDATLDLTSASDLVSWGPVVFLLPLEWSAFLERFRSSHVQYNGDVIKLEKFSSMGNGFTFPLESLIFHCLAHSTVKYFNGDTQRVRAYGDDIIVPSVMALRVVEALRLSGFQLNLKKSFWEGPFRESCGADWLSGINIRPFFVKSNLTCESLFTIHNAAIRSGQEDLAEFIRTRYLHPSLWLFGPDGYGDGHLLGPWGGSPHNRGDGWGGFVFESFSWTGRLELRSTGYHVLPGYSIYARYAHESERNLDSIDRSYRKVFKASYLRRLCNKFAESLDVGLTVFRKNPRASLPGVHGFKRIRIYTFETPDYICS